MDATPTSELPKLLNLAYAEARASTRDLMARYRLNEYADFNLDANAGTLTFGTMVFDVQFVGAFESHTKQWRWAWAEDFIHSSVNIAAIHAQEFGKANDIESLTTRVSPATEEECWKWTAFAARLAKWPGIYRVPLPNGMIVFVAFRPQGDREAKLIAPPPT